MSEKVDTGTTAEGRDWSVSAERPASECYPKSDSYIWGAFAGMAIELGGYNDITAVDPYTGQRFWLADAFRCDVHTRSLRDALPGNQAMAVMQHSSACEQCQVPFLTAVRRLLDAMEAAGWPKPIPDPDQN